MKNALSWLIPWVLLAVVLLGAPLAAFATQSLWWPWLKERLEASQAAAKEDVGSHAGHEEHAGHDEGNSLELSLAARKSMGVDGEEGLAKVKLSTFERMLTIPGLLVECPGRSQLQITAPMTGIVTKIHPIRGEAVRPAELLFEIRLTHEELVQAQADYLRTAEELDVIAREVKRLEPVAEKGVAGKALLERQYEQQKQEAIQRAQRQSLLLHGLTEKQIDEILKTRKLLGSLEVTVPSGKAMTEPSGMEFFQVQELNVQQGQHVTAGDPLAVLTDHATLYVEGNAFERDIADLQEAVEKGATLSAVIESDGRRPQKIDGLKILFLDNKVNPESREFHFYVLLPNSVARDATDDDGKRFVSWRYRPGQRVQLQVPVETWTDRIVLPVDAVAQEGLENYVFQPNGDHFDRRPVQVEYRDQYSVVIANDGTLFPGDKVALRGAQQMQIALKNKAAGPIDPHAGHNH